jgi:hypothetical protein
MVRLMYDGVYIVFMGFTKFKITIEVVLFTSLGAE